MSITTVKSAVLPADDYLAVRYGAPSDGWIGVEIDAQETVYSFVVDRAGLDQFQRGAKVSSYGGLDRRRQHVFYTQVPPRRQFFLVVFNPHDTPVAVAYRVWPMNRGE